MLQGKSFKKIQTGSLKQQYPQAGTGHIKCTTWTKNLEAKDG
jgi:hypothetical protein